MRKRLCNWFGHSLSKVASEKRMDVVTLKAVEEDTHWMCARCGKRYATNFNFKTKKLSTI